MNNKNDQEQLKALRHSAEHVLTQAMYKLYPNIKMAMGPATEEGFYFDFEVAEDLKINPEDFAKIEKEMQKIIDKKMPIIKQEISANEAKKLFKNNPYKLEWIENIEKDGLKPTVYWTGEPEKLPITFEDVLKEDKFVDLCAGPHVESTSQIGAFKLLKTAGAYWRGDEKNKMLTRIYGTAFNKENELKDYLNMLEEAEKRDHRKLGQELELFMLDEEVGQGLPLWLPNGAILRQEMEDFILTEYQKRGYQLIRTPHIASVKLFEQSGHLSFYKDGMYSPMDIDGEDYYVKPMNCPMHVKIYNNTPKSYRDLPIRYTELGTVYRYERSGTLHGLTRVRGFTQDDAHIICTSEQLTDELVGVIELTKFILKTFGFEDFKVYLSVRGEKNKAKYLGDDKDWELAETGLKKALEISGWKYQVDEDEAVFYGPKIDVKALDSVGREWQISTLQLDFNLPQRFEMEYTDKKGEKQKPFMLHRALLGSIERFSGILIEHYAGKFPLWLSPVQVKIVAVSEKHIEHCQNLANELKNQGIRSETDISDETVGNKIRKAIQQKSPYMLVIGDKEIESDKLMVRKRDEKEVTEFTKDEFMDRMKTIIEEKTQEL